MKELIVSTLAISLGALAAEMVRAWLARRSDREGVQYQLRTRDGQVIPFRFRPNEDDMKAAIADALRQNGHRSGR